ncbi:MAG: hypothetical protein Q7S27_05490 [Nanoarchaeota archaeon]|nr:hypothetical protein [Nanoarchaeota archaeon]
MADKELIAYIVRTYDLPSPLEEKITRKAIRRIDELFIDGFDNIYEEVDQLVQRFTNGHSPVSLDRPIKPGSGPLSTFIEQRSVSELMPEKEDLSRDQILNVLERRIDPCLFSVLQNLLDQNGKNRTLHLNISPQEIEKSTEEIQYKLEELVHKYEQRGTVIIPTRPIIHVQFDPLEIKWGNRRYNGNPLGFFKEHQQKYQGMSRGELSLFDSGLYNSLLKCHQLNKAIPFTKKTNKNRHLSQEQKNEINNSYADYNGNARETARHLHYTENTIIGHWRKAGFEIKKAHRSLPQNVLETIIEAYSTFNGNSTKAAEHLKRGVRTVRKYWREAGLGIKTRKEHSNNTFWREDELKNEQSVPTHQIGSWRGFSSPLEYFKANSERFHGLGRTQLSRSDIGLYHALLKAHQMDEAIPKSLQKRKPRKFNGNPLAYFMAHESTYKEMTRGQLRAFDQGLWLALSKAKQLDQAIPKTGYRGYRTPLEYVHANPEQFKNLTKSQLKKKDSGLYKTLRRLDQIDEVVSTPTLPYRGHETPLDYFRAHFYKYDGMTRTRLSLTDSGLYRSLVRYGQLNKAIPAPIEENTIRN